MCQAVQRKRFFSSGSKYDGLPTTVDPAAAAREAPQRSQSADAATPFGRCDSLPTFDERITDGPYRSRLLSKCNRNNNKNSKRCNPGLTLASLAGCLLLAVVGALIYQGGTYVRTLEQIKNEIGHHLGQINDLKVYAQMVGKISSYDIEDKDKHLYYLEHYRLNMHQGIQLMSQRMLQEKYGPGPKYYVEMHLSIDPRSNVYQEEFHGENDIVVIETASSEVMPHSVFQFLEMVSNHVYDGTIFYRNAQHILQAGPTDNAERLHKLESQHPSLAHVAFQEYSPDMPHIKYTLGFPDRPGGPDFYINMQDNRGLHGPGGQAKHYGDVGDADPCFATVIQGKEAIDRVRQSDVEPSGYHDRLVHPVKIQKMIVLDPRLYQPASRLRKTS